MNQIRNQSDLDRLFQSVRLMSVIVGWASQGLFEAMMEAESMALQELPGDDRALRVTARILANAGLLVRRGDEWALSPSGANLYDEGLLSDDHSLSVFQDLTQISDLLTDGGPVRDEDGEKQSSRIGVYPDDPERSREFLKVLHRRSESSAKETARWIDKIVGPNSRVLDLGGGHGRYGYELVELGHQATVFDFPLGVEVARELHGDTLECIEGDFLVDDLGGPYDVVLASNIIHGLSEKENQTLVVRIADALAPGGLLVIKDMFLDEFGLWPPGAVYFSMLMLMYTDEGDCYSLDIAQEWFRRAGLDVLDPVVFDGFALVVGQK